MSRFFLSLLAKRICVIRHVLMQNPGLTTQIRNSSRSVPANVAEGWSKRRYENIFNPDFGLNCGYFLKEKHDELVDRYNEVGKKLYRLIENWKTF